MIASYLSTLSAACLCGGVCSVLFADDKNGTGRFVRFVLSLLLIAALFLPLKDCLASLPSLFDGFSLAEASDEADEALSLYRYESGIKQMLYDKFKLDPMTVGASIESGNEGAERVTVRLFEKTSHWLSEDIKRYLCEQLNCEVTVYVEPMG